MKKGRPLKFSHTSNMKKGMGDFYGSAVKNPMARPVDVFSEKPGKSKDKGKPPKSVA